MLLTEGLVQGVDVWINTPRRPWEACGTSGMKVLGNGGINLSELDGWWAEAYTPDVGWALRDGQEHGAIDAALLHQPHGARIHRAALSSCCRGLPSACSHQGALGRQVVDWQHAVDQQWGSLGFGDVRVDSDSDQHVVEVEIFLNDLDPNAVRVELYADAINGGDPVREEMRWLRTLPDASRRCVYHATLPSARPASDYTARVIPQRSGVAVPLECARILWQR